MNSLRGLKTSRPIIRRLSSWAQLSSLRAKDAPFDIHPEVEDALAHNIPVVALETALVTHGLPYPSSLEVPLGLEEIVRSTGSIPATIGIIDGRIKIGLERDELERLADRRRKPAKVSRRDIAAAIAMQSDGGTTCSATLVFAALAGIKVFATGGLGGVHRGGENSLDISADLQELSRCPVGLVSAGVKSILDIGRTLEYLESAGVPVFSYGDSKEFPAFFSRHSGYYAPWNIDNPALAAKVLHAQTQLNLQNGALIGVPIPEKYEAAGKQIQQFVDQAVAESEQNGMNKRGKDVTPWLLDRIAKLSEGGSLSSNIALLENTALIGGQIAVQYQKLVDEAFHNSGNKSITRPKLYSGKNATSPLSKSTKQHVESLPSASVVIIGSAAIDITAQALPSTKAALAVHSTAPGNVKLTLGGVGRNIAEASHRVMEAKYPNLSSVLVAPIGRDAFGHLLVDESDKFNMRTDGLLRTDKRTAVCNMVLDSEGTLVGGVADMAITESLTGAMVIPPLQKYSPSIVALDGNLPTDTIDALVTHCNQHSMKVLFEPTSTIKSTTILPAILTRLKQDPSGASPVAYCTPNLLELAQIFQTAQSDLFELMDHPSWWSVINGLNLGSAFRMDLEQLSRKPVSDQHPTKGNLSFLIDQGIAQKAINLLPFFQHLIIKCGDLGVFVAMYISPQDAKTSGWAHERSNPHQRQVVAHGTSKEITVLQHFPALPIEALVNVTGAGDSFVGALVASLAHNPAGLYDPKSLRDIITTSQKAAILTLQSHSAVSPLLSQI
ncbi:indigoidine synthase A-like protein [Crassisporium funariophilum]|nr:indigoidine synthase A-like protein [Crassisporium funariophilum]